MAIRQYVGARYVPTFYNGTQGNSWESNVNYEALTIVTFNNSSYTSKVPVPATVGNPANNPDYWALTGNYNAQVSEYQSQVAEYQTQVTNYQKEVEQYQSDVSTVTDLIKKDSDGNTEIPTNENLEITTGKNEIHDITGNREVNVTGDNNTDINGNSEENYAGTHTVYEHGTANLHAFGNKTMQVDGEFFLNTANPLKYGTPQSLDDNFNYVPMTDASGNEYKVLVYNGKSLSFDTDGLQKKRYKKAIIVGDSWAVGYYDGAGHSGQGWGDYACPLLGVTGENILTIASGGSGFCNGTGEHFDAQIKRAYDEYPGFRDADLIICVGGFNDAQDNQTFDAVQQAAGSFFANCFTYFPNAETHMFPLQLPYGAGSAMSEVRWGVLSGIKQAFYNQQHGNLFLHDGIRRWANSFGAGASASDGSHLNQYGYNYLGQLIAMCIQKGESYYPTLRGSFNTTDLASYLDSTIANYCAEDNSEVIANLCLQVHDLPQGTYIKVPDFMSRSGITYFYVGNTLFAWNEQGITVNSGTYTGFIILPFAIKV